LGVILCLRVCFIILVNLCQKFINGYIQLIIKI